jgi:hypothetical protein
MPVKEGKKWKERKEIIGGIEWEKRKAVKERKEVW